MSNEVFDITAPALRERGYLESPIFGMVKEIGNATICVGYAPRNCFCVSIRFAHLDGTVMTNIETLEDIQTLERLLGGCFIDGDNEEFCDEEDTDQ